MSGSFGMGSARRRLWRFLARFLAMSSLPSWASTTSATITACSRVVSFTPRCSRSASHDKAMCRLACGTVLGSAGAPEPS